MIRMVVFDMAGTTVDEDNVVYRTLQEAISAAGYPVSLPQVLAWGAGKEKLQAVRDILAEIAPAAADTATAIHADFRLRLAQAYDQLAVRPCPGAETVFRSLRAQDIRVVLNTGYDRATAEGLLRKLDWIEGRDIDLLVTASDVAHNRPRPDMIHFAQARLGITDGATVAKAGDSIIDIEEGKAAGCGLTFGVTTGAHTAAQLATARPDAILETLAEILPWVAPASA